MDFIQLFEGVTLLSVLIFFIPSAHFRAIFSFLAISVMVVASTQVSWQVFASGEVFSAPLHFHFWAGSPIIFVIDKLSAFFIVITNLAFLAVSIYNIGYLGKTNPQNKVEVSLHLFAFNLLYSSLLAVLSTREALVFLFSWEAMVVTSFMLMLYQGIATKIIKVATKYFVYMHICLVILLIGFFVLQEKTGAMSFDALQTYFSSQPNIPLFLIFFVGFGIKAGFMPFHTWLPHADAAAPPNAAAIMSGVMVKMGIYGILRVLSYLQNDFLYLGLGIFILSLNTALFGIMHAIFQRDIRKKLAYSTIENIGIIGSGIGLGMIGIALKVNALVVFGFMGALLHSFNHSLFKVLLFLGTGSVFQQLQTADIEKMGGVMKNMRQTGVLYLIGCLAVAGMPPFNGFISEFLLYNGLFVTLQNAGVYKATAVLGGILGLVLTGGLSLFCFTKLFSISFLGTARSNRPQYAKEVSFFMLAPQYLIVVVMLLVGLYPSLFVQPISVLVGEVAHIAPNALEAYPAQKIKDFLQPLSNFLGIFISVFSILLVIKYIQQNRKSIVYAPTWGCGYTAGTPKLQYTSASFADNLLMFSGKVIGVKKKLRGTHNNKIMAIDEEEIFPTARSFKVSSSDVVEEYIYNYPAAGLVHFLKKAAVVQTGNIQTYLLYAFLFLLSMVILTVLNII